jgi:hypothetical protein
VPEWEPANAVESAILPAVQRGDLDEYGRILAGAELYLPVSGPAARGSVPLAWATASLDGATLLVAFTSPDALAAATRGEAPGYRTLTLRQLVAVWPDPSWYLLVNPTLPVETCLPGSHVARLAAPELDAPIDASTPTVMQKVVAPADLVRYLGSGDDRVGGYVHRLADVAHLDNPDRLVRGLAPSCDPVALSVDDGSVHVLRWPLVGARLYRVPYGGLDADAMRAMAGWVVEEPPFVGTGFVPNTEEAIQEYLLHSVRLPHGSEIHRIDRDGAETHFASYDADVQRWLVTVAARSAP